MAREAADLPPESAPLFLPVADDGEAGGLVLEEWLAEVAGDESVVLPKPAAAYLDEARAAGYGGAAHGPKS